MMTATLLLTGSLVFLCSCVVVAAGDDVPEELVAPQAGSREVERVLLIPGGEFVMGEDSGWDYAPTHRVRVDAFYIDAFEVTNAEYLAFCEATGRKLPEFWGEERFRSGPDYPDHPVTGVNWHDAVAYAEWKGGRLPTEAEWEYAARGGLSGMPYPHGDELSPEVGNYSKSELGGPVPVGSYAPNGLGMYDALGNVCEWVHDTYHPDYYKESPADNPRGPAEGYMRVIRGGGWHTGPGCVWVFHRNALRSNWLDFNVGFRCAWDRPPADGDDAGGSSP